LISEFSQYPVPADEALDLKYVVLLPSVTDLPRDTKTTTGRDIVRDLEVWWPYTGSTVDVDLAAERVREILHRQKLTVDGYRNYITSASGPVAGPSDDKVVSRVVTARFVLEKEA
jgi:hypothetical protein